MKELKPCPFCGSKNLHFFDREAIISVHRYDRRHPEQLSSYPYQTWIECRDCGAEIRSKGGYWARPLEREVLEKWNRRAT